VLFSLGHSCFFFPPCAPNSVLTVSISRSCPSAGRLILFTQQKDFHLRSLFRSRSPRSFYVFLLSFDSTLIRLSGHSFLSLKDLFLLSTRFIWALRAQLNVQRTRATMWFQNLAFVVALLASQVNALSNITYYSDDLCNDVIIEKNGPDDGTCTQFPTMSRSYSSFRVSSLDQTCSGESPNHPALVE